MKAPTRIELPRNLNALYIERHTEGFWLLPLSTDPSRTLGSFLKLYDNGRIERIHVRDDEADTVVLIKPEDRNT